MYYLERTRNILIFIEEYRVKYKYPPTLKEIAESQNITTQAIHQTMENMISDKYLSKKSSNVQRDFHITKKGLAFIN